MVYFLQLLVDQKMNDGVEAKLFGLRAMTTPAPAGLAVRYNVPIVPACVERVKGASFRITVYNPITAKPGADPVEDTLRMTQELNDFLEARIRERDADTHAPDVPTIGEVLTLYYPPQGTRSRPARNCT